MSDKNYTHILFILDRSGSMNAAGKAEAAIGGLNHFVKEQAEQDGKCTATLVQFDSIDPFEVVYSFKDIGKVPSRSEKNYQPRGGTPLLDCVGKAITVEKDRIKAMNKAERPALIIVNILTDGEENQSYEWNLDGVKKLIEKRQKKGWKIMFTGAGVDAFADASRLGINKGLVAQVGGHKKGVTAAYAAKSSFTSRARKAVAKGQKVDTSYDKSERGQLDSGK